MSAKIMKEQKARSPREYLYREIHSQIKDKGLTMVLANLINNSTNEEIEPLLIEYMPEYNIGR